MVAPFTFGALLIPEKVSTGSSAQNHLTETSELNRLQYFSNYGEILLKTNWSEYLLKLSCDLKLILIQLG